MFVRAINSMMEKKVKITYIYEHALTTCTCKCIYVSNTFNCNEFSLIKIKITTHLQ